MPGRFELVDAGQPFPVVVDYAHTPDGLEQLLLGGARRRPVGAVTVVFGCGGDRDATKRPAMGEVAATLADRVVLTADNSRGEETGAIIDAVSRDTTAPPSAGPPSCVVEPDRRRAIALALSPARPGRRRGDRRQGPRDHPDHRRHRGARSTTARSPAPSWPGSASSGDAS